MNNNLTFSKKINSGKKDKTAGFLTINTIRIK